MAAVPNEKAVSWLTEDWQVTKAGLIPASRYDKEARIVRNLTVEVVKSGGWFNVRVWTENPGPNRNWTWIQFGYEIRTRHWAYGKTPPVELIDMAIKAGLVL